MTPYASKTNYKEPQNDRNAESKRFELEIPHEKFIKERFDRIASVTDVLLIYVSYRIPPVPLLKTYYLI